MKEAYHEKKTQLLIFAVTFLPAAVSMVGASVDWKSVHAYRPIDVAQMGILNALLVTAGEGPVGWLIKRSWVNSLALITVGIWIWTGFCMMILSAAYKNIPKDLLEAARIREFRRTSNVSARLIVPIPIRRSLNHFTGVHPCKSFTIKNT
jgi:alpha-glucoside transport system permease protein